MRQLTSHQVEGRDEPLQVLVLDEPGPGGACHRYRISPVQNLPYERDPKTTSRLLRARCDIRFQQGPIQEADVNGVTMETLLAVVEDRLAGFQAGDYACQENEEALDHVRKALGCLKKRTADRLARGVEGTCGQ